MKVVLPLIVLMFVLGVAVLMADRGDRKDALSAREKQELEALRAMRDEIFKDALSRVEVDPSAGVTIDIIRHHEMRAFNSNKKAK